MARIDWALLCDHVSLDRHDQPSIRIVRSLPTPPLAVRRLTLVAHLADIQPIDEIEVSIGMVTPSGHHAARPGSGHVSIEMCGDYVLATLRDLLLIEEGVHRFQIRLRGQPVVAVGVPVREVMIAKP
jgi:hypothetical protein